jgi:uncharacterized protein YkwD
MKSTLKWTLVLAVLLAVLLQPPSAWGQLRTQSGSLTRKSSIKHPRELERRIFQLTNEARRKNGLPSLDPDETLAACARQHSDDMLRRDYFSHTSPDGKDMKDRLLEAPAAARSVARAGENIYGGRGQDFSDAKTISRVVVDGWMTSPGHRANILNPDYTHLGVGVSVQGKDIRATQNFAHRVKSP